MPVTLYADPVRPLTLFAYRSPVDAADLAFMRKAFTTPLYELSHDEILWFPEPQPALAFSAEDLVRTAYAAAASGVMLPPGARRRSAMIGPAVMEETFIEIWTQLRAPAPEARTEYRRFTEMEAGLDWLGQPGPLDMDSFARIAGTEAGGEGGEPPGPGRPEAG